MITIKAGVKILSISPELTFGLMIVNSVFVKYGIDLVLTEATGAKHSVNSLHYKGWAADIRSKHIGKQTTKHAILFECCNALGKNFDMILENESQDSEHFHMEFDPK